MRVTHANSVTIACNTHATSVVTSPSVTLSQQLQVLHYRSVATAASVTLSQQLQVLHYHSVAAGGALEVGYVVAGAVLRQPPV